MQLSSLQYRLIEGWQRDFPLVPRPYEAIGAALNVREDEVMGALRDLKEKRVLSRVGAAVRANAAGASTLAAMRVPVYDIPRVADIVNAEAGVNHNYEREHEFNLWFVVTGGSRTCVSATLSRIKRASGHEILNLPLEKPYFIDLGFPLGGKGAARQIKYKNGSAQPPTVTEIDRRLLANLEEGLPLASRPYAHLPGHLGLEESEVIAALGRMCEGGVISRLGLIVQHRELGFNANAMVVWDIPDAETDTVGERFASQPFVTLCYRRPRRLPEWPYNLFCMIHGRERSWVLGRIEELKALVTPAAQNAVLFSNRCFKQRGARFSAA
jgi:siroheme decarboxylase